MDKEKYFREKLEEYKEAIIDKINAFTEFFLELKKDFKMKMPVNKAFLQDYAQ